MIKLVKTSKGAVQGLSGNNARISVFKGIPYAKPPVGELRWHAPVEADPWDGVLKAYDFAPISIQDTPGLGTDVYCREWHVDPDIVMDEDCLYLNVWTPANSSSEKLPVLVWIFGGAFQWGYPSEMEFNAENIAKRGIVVVSMNYRLGPLGFLAHRELSEENPKGCTNFGNLDQLMALKWVKENIEAFGGDSNCITLAGQSAGGASVLSHLTSRESRDYINRAIILSGMIRTPYYTDPLITPKPLCEAEAVGRDFLDYLGVSSIKEARELDAIFIRDKYADFAKTHPRFAPCIDGTFIEDDPYRLYLKGDHLKVPVIAGNTIDEFISYIDADNDCDFEKKAKEIFGERAEKFLSFPEAYKREDNHYAALRSIEVSVKCAFLNNGADSYYYCFEPFIPGDDNPGCFHSVDLWFFFETLAASRRPFDGKYYDLSRQMCNYITNFMRSGNPNGLDHDGSPLPQWQPYSANSKNEMRFTTKGAVPTIEDNDFVAMGTFLLYQEVRKRIKECPPVS